MKRNKKSFVGRAFELKTLAKIGKAKESSILIVYGRRRVGKTELIEHAYGKRKLLKFEGVEGRETAYQQKVVMQQLAQYVGEPLLKEIKIDNWIDVFRQIHNYTSKGTWTLYFEEVQWLASYQPDFISELKYAWDNFFRYNPNLILILCGSATSFMINEVVRSKALYNRSQNEIHLREFSLKEMKMFFPRKSIKEIMDGYLILGGIPEYLKRLKTSSSVFLSLCKNSFIANSPFSKEYEKIFISHLATNKNYRKIIEFLSKRRFATRDEILHGLDIKSGGRITELLEDLILCGFIESYVPYYLTEDGKLVRYAVRDAYLQFYYKFIKPIEKNIQLGIYNEAPTKGINEDALSKWLGFSFERFCRTHHHLIAKILEFSSVRYRAGSFFNRASMHSDPGYQLDLVFDRDDNVLVLCEIKYLKQKVPLKVIYDFEKKLELFGETKNKTIQKVLITTFGAEPSVIRRGYFDRIITLQDFFNLK